MDHTRTRCFDALLFAAGTVLLLAGATFYVLFRTEPVAFMQWADIAPATDTIQVSGSIAGWIPSFAHAAAFTLLTASWLERRTSYVLAAATGWFAINAAFEILQLVPDPISVELPSALANFAAAGTFDPRDIAGAAAGALSGAVICWIMILPRRGRGRAEVLTT